MNDEADAGAARLSTARRLQPSEVVRPALDRLAALARRIVGTASAQVSLVTDVAMTVGASEVPGELQGDIALSESMCALTAARARPLVINDTRSSPDVAHMPAVTAGLAASFLGVPVRADDRSVVGALCVFDPAPRLWMQDDVASLEALAESAAAELEFAALARDFDATRARWDLAIESAGVGSFDWDLRTGQLSWDARLIQLFGYDDDDVFDESIEAFNARLHPDDLPSVTQALQRAIETVGDYEAEYRVVLPDGTIRQVQARGRALGEGSVASRLLGAAWDVSATRGSEDRAARLIEAMPVGYLRIAADATVLAANQLAESLLHVHRLDLLHRVLWDVVPETVAARLGEICAQVLRTGAAVTDELQFLHPIDAWLELRVWPDDGGLTLFFTDITVRRRAQAAADTLAEHDREIATALQQALLTHLPERDHLELRARYVPAAVADQVGGDWYDAVVQPGGATTIAVGDVSGHDTGAAATMGQLRSMLRAFVWQSDDPPSTVITALDRAMADLYPRALATAVVARIEQDPEQVRSGVRRLRWTNAGHLPPALVSPDGSVRFLEATPELMLGVHTRAARTDHVHELAPGSTLVLYTDGLVERRDADLDAGLRRLADSLRDHHERPTEVMIDRILADMLSSHSDDDVVILVTRLHPQT